jgi:hypothetical protein
MAKISSFKIAVIAILSMLGLKLQKPDDIAAHIRIEARDNDNNTSTRKD